ncbi:pseudouridine synthase [Risungbinella massiliensis]|uniref:pseudouridine synthase n=1 Tax=Risungbinella massiliensis TaxID=1329796 RepID=UPI000AAE7FE5|nr:pseudouridine synthase [Risungbinella massiliensis]
MATNKRQRLDKILAHLGLGTRKEVKKILKDGKVRINEVIQKDPKLQIDPYHDRIQVEGETYHYREFVYFMMHKPPGVISATEDVRGHTVVDLLEKEDARFEPFPVGRLDKDTEGLLLLTNDGKLAHELLAPKKHVSKTYFARIEGEVTDEDCFQFAKGVILDDGYETLPAKLNIKKQGAISEVEITIVEGKFHQIKRMFTAVGKKVVYLKRLTMGPLHLDPKLQKGSYRELTKEELELLKRKH